MSIVDVPDIHLSATRAVLADAGVLVVARFVPFLHVGLAVDELEIPRALGVAVAGAVLGTCLVAGILLHAAILVHGNEVEGSVEAASVTCQKHTSIHTRSD